MFFFKTRATGVVLDLEIYAQQKINTWGFKLNFVLELDGAGAGKPLV
jgi:hypothetical protein